MIRESFPAMGTTIIAVASEHMGIEATRSEFARLERLCSRFDAASELSWLNRQPTGRVEISADLAAIFTAADHLRTVTDGLVDPAVGAAVIDWGYDRTFSDVKDLDSSPAFRRGASWSLAGNIIDRPRGVRFDLGGIAKGWTCDRVVESGMAVLVSAGGDMRSVCEDGIAEIEDPWQPNVAARIAVGIGALATSSTARRRWMVEGRQASHIIDPRSSCPVESPIVSATVTATTAVEAEAGAKGVLLHGANGLAWADTQPWINGAMACWDTGAVFATGSLELAA